MVVTIGATVVSDTLSLIVFAICVSTYATGFSLYGLMVQIVEIAIFVPLMLVRVSRAGAWVLRQQRENEEAYFVTMLGIMAVSGLLADLINLPGIVGAFLAGLSVNVAVDGHPAKQKLEFFGKALFIPSFFIVTRAGGVRVDTDSWSSHWLPASLQPWSSQRGSPRGSQGVSSAMRAWQD